MSTRETLIAQLQQLPADLAAAERELLDRQTDLSAAKELLLDAEATYTAAGLPGRNAEEREAHLRRMTPELRENVQTRQERVAQASLRVRVLQAEFSAIRAIARLLGGADGRDDG